MSSRSLFQRLAQCKLSVPRSLSLLLSAPTSTTSVSVFPASRALQFATSPRAVATSLVDLLVPTWLLKPRAVTMVLPAPSLRSLPTKLSLKTTLPPLPLVRPSPLVTPLSTTLLLLSTPLFAVMSRPLRFLLFELTLLVSSPLPLWPPLFFSAMVSRLIPRSFFPWLSSLRLHAMKAASPTPRPRTATLRLLLTTSSIFLPSRSIPVALSSTAPCMLRTPVASKSVILRQFMRTAMLMFVTPSKACSVTRMLVRTSTPSFARQLEAPVPTLSSRAFVALLFKVLPRLSSSL